MINITTPFITMVSQKPGLLFFVFLMMAISSIPFSNATSEVQIDGLFDSGVDWNPLLSDFTYDFFGYRHRQDPSNTLNFEVYYHVDNENLYIFIETDDNTVNLYHRDHFSIFFDVKPYGLGREDIAYEISVPHQFYCGGILRHGPKWGDISSYNDIASASENGKRTFEVKIPLSYIVPDPNNPIYEDFKYMVYLENYGHMPWKRELLINFYPDDADRCTWWRHSDNWATFDLPSFTHTFDITSSTTTGGSITPLGTITLNEHSTRLFEISPDIGNFIVDVLIDGQSVGSVTSYTFTDIQEDHTIDAFFEPYQYLIDISTFGFGSVEVEPYQSTYHYGDSVTISAIPDSGWRFSRWSGDLSDTEIETSLIIDGDKEITAEFTRIPEYTLTVITEGSGTVAINPDQQRYLEGTEVQMEALPSSGWVFASWSNELGSENPVSFAMNADIEVIANFAQITYNISASAGTGGTISPSGLIQVADGDNYTFTISPNVGYEIAEVIVDGTSIGVVDQYIFTNVCTNHFIEATFSHIEYTVSIDVIGNGIVSSNPSETSFLYGEAITLTAYPDTGWRFIEWSGDATGIDPELSIIIDGDKQIIVEFMKNVYQITSSCGAGGEVIPAGTMTFEHGETQTYSFLPLYGYEVINVLLDGESIVAVDGYLFHNIQNNHILEVTFSQIEHLIHSTSNIGGSITPPGNVIVFEGDSESFTITPDPGNYILDVLIDGESVGPIEVYTFTNVNKGHSIEAVFAEEIPTLYSISESSGLGGSISPAGTVLVEEGAYQLFNIIPDSGYHITDVIVDTVSQGDVTSYTFYDISSPHTIEAIFSEDIQLDIVSLNIEPSVISDPSNEIGDTFWVSVRINELENELLSYVLDIKWNPNVLKCLQFEWSNLFDESLQLSGTINNENGKINQITESSLASGFNGDSGALIRLQFEIINYGDSEIRVQSAYLEGTQGAIASTNYVGVFHLSPPPANPPQAMFTPADDAWFYYGDLITLDASSSLSGYDTLPVAEICPIQTYTWAIDYAADETIEELIEGEIVDFEVLCLGEVKITLTVSSPDPTGPEHGDGWGSSDTVSKIINITARPTGANLDLYTERGGELLSEACAYGPQELVVIHANVTYNEAPVVGKDVLITIYDKNGNEVGVRTARSNYNGVATASFRLPWPDEDPESLFGQWKITGSVDVAETTNTDTVYFEFGYILEIISVSISPEQVARDIGQTNAEIIVTSIACEDIDAILVLTIEDELQVPVSSRYSWQTFAIGGTTYTEFNGLHIPNWAYVGLGKVHISVLSTDPLNYGIPYCSTKQANIIISLI